jgi:WD40 repeat protein
MVKKLLLCPVFLLGVGLVRAMETEPSISSVEIAILCANDKKLIRTATEENIQKLNLIKKYSGTYQTMFEDLGSTEEQNKLTLYVPSLARTDARLLWEFAPLLDKSIMHPELFNALSELPLKLVSRLLNVTDYLDMPELREQALPLFLAKVTSSEWLKSWVEKRKDNSALQKLNPSMSALLATIIELNEAEHLIIPWKVLIRNEVPILSLSLSPDRKQVATCYENIVFLWDAHSGEFIKNIDAPNSLATIIFSNDASQIAGGSNDDNAYLWNSLNGNLLKTLSGHTGTVKAVAFSPDGTQLVTGSFDGTIRLWNLKNDSSTILFSDNMKLIQTVAFSADGKLIAFGGSDKMVNLWSVEANQMVASFLGHTDVVKCIALSPNGKLIASGGIDNIVCVWDLEKKVLVKKLQGHLDQINAIAFTHDNTKIISAGSDDTVRIWSAGTGTMLKMLKGHTGPITSLALGSNDDFLITGSRDATAIKWILNSDLSLQQLLLMIYLVKNAPVTLENKKSIELFETFDSEIKKLLIEKYGVVTKINAN